MELIFGMIRTDMFQGLTAPQRFIDNTEKSRRRSDSDPCLKRLTLTRQVQLRPDTYPCQRSQSCKHRTHHQYQHLHHPQQQQDRSDMYSDGPPVRLRRHAVYVGVEGFD